MDREAFRKLFLESVSDALRRAGESASRRLSGQCYVELHGCGVSGALISLEEAVDLLYIDKETFYRVIDVGLKAIQQDKCIVFVRVSAHPPSTFDKTWNTPKGSGPFKVIEPLTVENS